MKVFRLLACFFLAGVVVANGQVVRLAGGASSLSAAEGVSAGLYEADRTSQIGFGFAQGFSVSASREAHVGNATMIAGDTTIALRLPTDLQDASRVVSARGLMLRTEEPGNLSQAFIGTTGSVNGNAYFTSMTSVRPIGVFSTDRKLGKAELSALNITGSHSSSLVSFAVRPNQQNLVAMTTGFSGGAPVFRVAAHHGDGEEQLDVSYTGGQLKLQPQPDLMNSNLERIGWNISAAKHVTKWLFLDGARYEYGTAEAESNPLWKGVTASRSRLLEGAASVQFGHLQGTARAFRSQSGNQHSSGAALLAAWHTRRFETRVTSVRSTTGMNSLPDSPAPANETFTRATFVEGSQTLARRLVLRETINLGGGNRSFEAGGVYEGDRLSFSVGHREVFVPFGSQSGFRRLLVLSLRFRVHDTDLVLDTIRGAGMPKMWNVASEGYYGRVGQEEHTGVERIPSMPRYLVHGRVFNQNHQPLRGAAVAVGTQTVYTDSEGCFQARLHKKTLVQVALRPAEFLTPLSYVAASSPVLVAPEENTEHIVELSAELAKATAPPAEPEAAMSLEGDEQQVSGWKKSTHLLRTLFHRLMCPRGGPHKV